jgi:hypothetical protein
MMKVLIAALLTLVFLTLLSGIYVIHATYFRVGVVFYSALLDGLLATTIACVLFLSSSRLGIFTGFEKAQLVGIWLLSGYILAISVPTVIDRSLSLYILEKLQQRGGGILLASFEDVFTKEYVKEHRLVDVRLTEQLESGTIVIENGCVKLTAKGDRIAGFSRFFRNNLLPRHRLLMGTYSSDLTDPFLHSAQIGDYTCR